MSDEEKLHELLKLKRYETPGEEYFKRFGEEFSRRQKTAAKPNRSAMALAWERSREWGRDWGAARWAIPAGVFAAAVFSLVVLRGWESYISYHRPGAAEARSQRFEVHLPKSDEVDSLAPDSQKKKPSSRVLPAGFQGEK